MAAMCCMGTGQGTGDRVERPNQCYEKTMRTSPTDQSEAEFAPQIKALETVAPTHLRGYFFHRESLSGDLAFLQLAMREYDESGMWIPALEASLAESRATQ